MDVTDVTVVVPTTSRWWSDLARSRAIPSALALGVPAVEALGATVADARNAGLSLVRTSHVVHLDADDELEDRYLDELVAGTADVRAPAVRYVRGPHARRPARMPTVAGHSHDCVAACLREGNWLVVGALAPVELVRRVGGWREFEWSEDWDLWLRCYLAGATFEAIPAAVYRAYTRPDSRNRSTPATRDRVHHEIARANGLEP